MSVFFHRWGNSTGGETVAGIGRMPGQAGQIGWPAASDLVFVPAPNWIQNQAKHLHGKQRTCLLFRCPGTPRVGPAGPAEHGWPAGRKSIN